MYDHNKNLDRLDREEKMYGMPASNLHAMLERHSKWARGDSRLDLAMMILSDAQEHLAARRNQGDDDATRAVQFINRAKYLMLMVLDEDQ